MENELNESQNLAQDQVANVFGSVWGDVDTYSPTNNKSDLERLINWSDGKLSKWVTTAFSSVKNQSGSINVLDSGCGLGNSFINLIELIKDPPFHANVNYTGIDLIDLKKTEDFLNKWTLIKGGKFAGFNIRLIQEDMIVFGDENPNYFDLVISLGSMHHTPSVINSLRATFNTLKSGGYYIGWIINEQKPLRKLTDNFFRDFFSKFNNMEDCNHELELLALIFESLGKELGNSEIEIPEKSELLNINPGKYKLQTLLYDYFLKCYYVSGETRDRSIHQLFDWFAPHYYHQTSRSELEKFFSSLNNNKYQCIVVDCISKANGHFFFLRKIDC